VAEMPHPRRADFTTMHRGLSSEKTLQICNVDKALECAIM
jgi:hypothetical protein